MDTEMNGHAQRQPPPVHSEDYPTVGGPVFRFFFRREASEPLQVLKLRTVESSFAPAYRSWGSKVLLVWRVVLALYFIAIGIMYNWITGWNDSVIPLVYLTNWGVVAVAFYYIVASFNSVHSICIHWKYEPLSRFWRWLTAIQIFLFELTVPLETLITILYWSFEKTGFCNVDCVTGHALGNACLFIELFFSRLPIRPRHVLLTVIYPLLWVASQIWWVYTNHPPAYPNPLTMRDTKSIWVCILGIVAFVVAHFLFWLIALARDKFCEGRFYSADEVEKLDVKTIDAGVLAVSYLEDGPPDGWPVVLSHGFPFDVHAYDEVVPLLTLWGARVIRPYLRGYGPTRFLSTDTQRSGQQAALGFDLVALLGALRLVAPILAGYDWGGLASCVATALWPERVAGLVSLASYDVINVERLKHAYNPSMEHAVWYQHLFQTERGRECLARYRRELCRMLWRQWSPNWRFDEAIFERTAASFDNPDFVDVVIHAYRHDFGLAVGDPAYEELEERLARRPKITVPAVTLDGVSDTLKPGGTADQAGMFTARHEHRVIDAGHNLPQEAPAAFADAVLTVRKWLQAGEGN